MFEFQKEKKKQQPIANILCFWYGRIMYIAVQCQKILCTRARVAHTLDGADDDEKRFLQIRIIDIYNKFLGNIERCLSIKFFKFSKINIKHIFIILIFKNKLFLWFKKEKSKTFYDGLSTRESISENPQKNGDRVTHLECVRTAYLKQLLFYHLMRAAFFFQSLI